MSELWDSHDYQDTLSWKLKKNTKKDFTTFQNNTTSSGKHIQAYETIEEIHKPNQSWYMKFMLL